MPNLTNEALRSHFVAYHIDVSPMELWDIACPICGKTNPRKGLQKHIHFDHMPHLSTSLPTSMNTILHSFSLVVCRDTFHTEGIKINRYLLCQERQGEGFWIPGGHIDPGEHPTQGTESLPYLCVCMFPIC